MALVAFDPYTAVHSTPKYTLGAEYRYAGKVFRYVKITDLVDVAVGDVLMYTATEGVVTPDIAGGTANVGLVAGVAVVAVDVSTGFVYCFVQTRGYIDSVNVDAACVAGSTLVLPATADGRADLYTVAGANPTAAESVIGLKAFGRATAADAANIAPAYLFCM